MVGSLTGRYTPLSLTTVYACHKLAEIGLVTDRGVATSTDGVERRNSALRGARTAMLHWKTKNEQDVPLILYSPLSWPFELRMLRTDEAFDPTVSTRSKPGGEALLVFSVAGWRFSSLTVGMPGRRVKGFRIGIVQDSCWQDVAAPQLRRSWRRATDQSADGWMPKWRKGFEAQDRLTLLTSSESRIMGGCG